MKPKLYLINGPLGAGKTTLLKFLLKKPQFENCRVIENEFANVSVDTEELHDHITNIQTIAGVCICCSTGEELIDALNDLAGTTEPVIIEATGVANSLKLIEKIAAHDLLDTYDVAHSFFVIDAAEIVANGSIVDIHLQEIEAADAVIVTKTDLLDEIQRDKVMRHLQDMTSAAVIASSMGSIDMGLLHETSHILDYFVSSDSEFNNHDSDMNYSIISTENIALQPVKLEDAWNRLRTEYGLGRLKGNITDQDGTLWHVEATPSQFKHSLQPQKASLRLVFIGADARGVTLDKILGETA